MKKEGKKEFAVTHWEAKSQGSFILRTKGYSRTSSANPRFSRSFGLRNATLSDRKL